jgi:rhodanese-related sulfurtransferase
MLVEPHNRLIIQDSPCKYNKIPQSNADQPIDRSPRGRISPASCTRSFPGATERLEARFEEQSRNGQRQPALIDVICNIPQAKLIPLGDLPKRVNELNSADEIVAHCKSGMRSAKAVDFLKQAGFKKVRNMKGGILAWSDKVDPSVPKY